MKTLEIFEFEESREFNLCDQCRMYAKKLIPTDMGWFCKRCLSDEEVLK